jgi:hypothetical protein
MAARVARSRAAPWLDRFPVSTVRRALFALDERDVLRVLAALDDAGVKTWLAGGWGVDALLRGRTRSHSDLDLVLDARDDPVPAALTALAEIGISHVDEAATGGRFMPELVKVTNRAGAAVDLLPVEPERLPSSAPFTTGTLGGRAVQCLSPDLQIAFHRGYRQRWSQRRDLVRLCARSGHELPHEPPGIMARSGRRLRRHVRRAGQRLLRTPSPRESALLVPVESAAELVRAWQDAPPAATVPPHITVLYPFVPAARIDGKIEREVAAVATAIPPFAYRLAAVGRFPSTLYVAPEPAAPFIDLTETFVRYWPEYPAYGGVYDDVVPHLSVVDSPEPEGAADAIARELPIETEATELWLMIESDDATWRLLRRFPLGR